MPQKKEFQASSILPLYAALNSVWNLKPVDSEEYQDHIFINQVTPHIDVHNMANGIRYETWPDWPVHEQGAPSFLLDVLRDIPTLRGRSPEVTSSNIRVAAKLGCVALERLAMRAAATQRLLSKTALRDVQRTFRHVGEQSALALAASDLPRNHAAEEIWVINRLVNPNSRVVQSWERRYGLGIDRN